MEPSVICKNLYTIRKIDADGNEHVLTSFHNMPLQTFYDVVSGYISYNTVLCCWFGTGSTPPDPTDTELEEPLWTWGFNNSSQNRFGWEKYLNESNHVCYKYTFKIPADENHVGEFSELGVCFHTGSVTMKMATRALVRDSSGNAITISKTALEVILVDVIFEFILHDGNGFKWLPENIIGYGTKSAEKTTDAGEIFSLGMLKKISFYGRADDACFTRQLYSKAYGDNYLTNNQVFGKVYEDDHKTMSIVSCRLLPNELPVQRYIKAIGIGPADSSTMYAPIGYWELPNSSVIPTKKLTDIEIGFGDGETTEFTAPLCEWALDSEEIYVNGELQRRYIDYICDCHPNPLDLEECSILNEAEYVGELALTTQATILPILGRTPYRNGEYLRPLWDKDHPTLAFALPENKITPIKRIVVTNICKYASTNADSNISWKDTEWSIEYSIDGESWENTETKQVTKNEKINLEYIFDQPISARYWRLRISGNLTDINYSVRISVAKNNNQQQNSVGIMAYSEQTPITFTNPPPEGARITMNAMIDCPMKNEDFVIDVNPTFSIGTGISSIIPDYGDGSNSQGSVTPITPVEISQPRIVTQPKSTTAQIGRNAVFTVKAAGGKLSYTWECSPDEGETWTRAYGNGSTCVISATNDVNGYLYRCRVSNSEGFIESDPATLTVVEALDMEWPTIVTHPRPVSVENGETATFSVEATGEELSYYWFTTTNNGLKWIRTDNDTDAYSFTANTNQNGMLIRCQVYNPAGAIYTRAARLNVGVADTEPPVIVTQPQPIEVLVHSASALTIGATGSNLCYNWEQQRNADSWTTAYDYTNECEVIGDSLDLGKAIPYRCIVSNTLGEVVSETVNVTTVEELTNSDAYMPNITVQPRSVTADIGETATFTIQAEGGSLTYRWEVQPKDADYWMSANVPKNTYSMEVTTEKHGWKVRCQVANGIGSVTSDEVTLNVLSIVSQGLPTILEPLSPQNITIYQNRATVNDKFSITIGNIVDGNTIIKWAYSDDSGETWIVDGQSFRVFSDYPVITYGLFGSGSRQHDALSSNGRLIRCTISNSNGSITSNSVSITVLPVPYADLLPKETTKIKYLVYFEMASKRSRIDIDVTSVNAVNKPDEPTYLWEESRDDGATWAASTAVRYNADETVYIDNTSLSMSGCRFRCRITNSTGTILSHARLLYVIPYNIDYSIVRSQQESYVEPIFTGQPQSMTAAANTLTGFMVTMSRESAPCHFDWEYSPDNGEHWYIAENYTDTMSVLAKPELNGYQYRCVVTNARTAVVSEPATLTVT